MEKTHIYPLNDLKEHVTDGSPCWCNPEVDEDDCHIIYHNSMDRREEYERGRKLS